MEEKIFNVSITPKTFFWGILFIVFFYLLIELREVALIFFLAFIINAGLRPIISFLEKRGFNRSVAIFLVYLFSFSLFFLFAFLLLNELVFQIRTFFSNLDLKIDSLITFLNANLPFLGEIINREEIILELKKFSDLSNLTSSVFYEYILKAISVFSVEGISVLGKTIAFLFNTALIIVVSVYMVSQKRNFHDGVFKILPGSLREKWIPIINKIEVSLGSWLLSQVLLMIIIGVSTYLIIIFPGFFDSFYTLSKYALIIAIIAGLLEAVPNIGPTLTLIITLIIAIASGAGISILIYIGVCFLLLQQFEALFIVPKLMQKALNLHPIVSILGIIAGFQLMGPLGALISVPVIGTIQIILIDFLKKTNL